MATKQDKAVQRAFLRGKKQGVVREEKHVLGLLVAAILILLYLLLAQHNGWWPYMRPHLGSAFYTNVSKGTTAPSSSSSNTSSSSSSSGGSSTSGVSTATGSDSGGSTSVSSGTNPIASFAAGVNVGDSHSQISSEANGLSQNCAVVVGATTQGAGKQQVCTYTEGDKIVTVTYLNDRVISASKSGF